MAEAKPPFPEGCLAARLSPGPEEEAMFLQDWLSRVERAGLRAALEGLGPDVRLSTGAMLFREGEWLFALTRAGLIFGLGGRPEPGEGLVEALKREAEEEARLRLEVEDSAATCLFLDQEPEEVRLPAGQEPRPAFIWRQGRQAASADLAGYACAVYRAAIGDQQPVASPADRVEGFIWLSTASLGTGGPLVAGQTGVRPVGLEPAPGTPLTLVGSAVFAGPWLRQVAAGVRVRPAGPEDWPAIVALLARAGLEAGGLREWLANTLVAFRDNRPVGVAACEDHGEVGLLRSLAVVPDLRGLDIGSRLARQAETEAAARGVKTLYLLTTTAPGLFCKLGYRPVARAGLPPALGRSRLVEAICPSSAQAMCRKIAP